MIAVIAEHQRGLLHPASLEALAAARALGDPSISIVLVGDRLSEVATALTSVEAQEIVLLEHDRLADSPTGGVVAALAHWIGETEPRFIFAAHTYQARDVMPRLAARLQRPLVTDCTAIGLRNGQPVFTRPIFRGRLAATVVLEGPPPHLVTLQVGAFTPASSGPSRSTAPISRASVPLSGDGIGEKPEPPFRDAGRAVDLSRADRIVAVGWGVQSAQHLHLIRELADALGAEVAASRPVCDAGWLPMERQVGSSGQTVAPRLYVAIGISGAVQHIVGMKGAKTIVAINKDPQAPIFEVADYGIVGDLFDVVPALISALRDSGPRRA